MYYQVSSSSSTSRNFSCDDNRCSPRCCCYSCCRESVLNDHSYGILKKVCTKIFKDLIRNKCQEKYAVFPGGNGMFEFDRCLNVKNPCDCGCYANRGIGNDNKGGKGQAGAKGDSEDKTKQKKQGDKGGGDNDDKGGKKKKKSFTSAAAVSTRPPKSNAKGKDGNTKDSINKQAKGKDSKKLDGQDPEEGKGDGKSRKDKDKENEKGGERPSKSNVKGKDGHGEHGDKSKGLSESQTGSCIGGQFLKGRKKSKMRRSKAAKGNLPNRFEETGISHLLRIKLENRDLCRCICNCCNPMRFCCQGFM